MVSDIDSIISVSYIWHLIEQFIVLFSVFFFIIHTVRLVRFCIFFSLSPIVFALALIKGKRKHKKVLIDINISLTRNVEINTYIVCMN